MALLARTCEMDEEMLAAACLLLVLSGALEGDGAFEQAHGLYLELEFDKAVVLFERAASAEGRTDEDRAVALLWAGLSHAQLGRFSEAEEAFVRAVRAHRGLAFPDGVSPKIQKIFEDARARTLKSLDEEAAARRAEDERRASAAAARAEIAENAEKVKARKAEARARAQAERADRARRAEAVRRAEEQRLAARAAEAQGATGGPSASGRALAEDDGGGALGTSLWAAAGATSALGVVVAVGGVGLLAASYGVYLSAAEPSTPQAAALLGGQIANGLWLTSLAAGGVALFALAAGGGCAIGALAASE